MQATFTNRLQTRSTVVRAIESAVSLGTAVLASVFVFAALAPHIGFVLIG